MPTHSEYDLNKPFFDSTTLDAPVPVQRGPRWSYTTLRAARPTPDKFRRSYAEDWNKQFPAGHELRVDPAKFPLETPERSPEEIEANLEKLRKLGNSPKFKVVDIWDKPE